MSASATQGGHNKQLKWVLAGINLTDFIKTLRNRIVPFLNSQSLWWAEKWLQQEASECDDLDTGYMYYVWYTEEGAFRWVRSPVYQT